MKGEDLNYREIFRDIVFGYSEAFFKGEKIYIKHLSVFDQINIESLKEEFYNFAKRRGLPNEEEALNILRENDIWTEKDDNNIKEKKTVLEGLYSTKKNLYLPSDIEDVNKKIEDAKKDHDRSLLKKIHIVGETCETYTDRRVSEHYILMSFYKEGTFVNRKFSNEDINELEREDIFDLVMSYNVKYNSFDDHNIQKVILEDFFGMYMPFCEDVRNFYDKPLFELSSNQVKLIVYSRMFKNIFENYPKIPDQIKKNPDKIIDYVNNQEKAKSTLKNIDKQGASTIVGAKKQDYEDLGVAKNQSHSLSDMLKQHGGKMDMKDLMKAMNK